MSNQLRIITVNEYRSRHMDLRGEIGKFTKIISKIHDSRKRKELITNHRENKGVQFTVHEENNTQFTNHRENKGTSIHGSRRK